MSGGLAARGLSVELGGRSVLDDLTFAVPPGAVTGLIGPNGAGKTTALRALLGLVPLKAGRVTLDGVDLTEYSAHTRARHIAYMPQGGIVHWPITVERLVTLGRLPHQEPWRAPGEDDRRAIAGALADADVAHLKDRAATELSGGERTRAMLARALATQAPALLADEPVAALDPLHSLSVMTVFQRLARSGRVILTVLHDLALAARFCDHLVLLERGRVAASGPPREVMAPDCLAAVYGVRFRGDFAATGFDFLEP